MPRVPPCSIPAAIAAQTDRYKRSTKGEGSAQKRGAVSAPPTCYPAVVLGYVLAAAALIVLGLYHLLPAWLADSAAGVVVAAGVVTFVRTVRHVNNIAGPMGTAALIGKEAIARTPLTPKGFVAIHGERWAAEIEDGNALTGATVHIVGAEGFCLKVRNGPPPVGPAKLPGS